MAVIETGITCSPQELNFVPRIEQLGFDSLWTNEHILFHEPMYDATVTLGAFAARTERIKLGTAVLLLPLRNPTVTAKAVATADIISGGRVLLGIGVGGEYPKEFEATGVPLSERGARTNEAIRVLRQLWTEDRTSFHGRWTNFDGVTMRPRPPQPGGPPIIIAGRSQAAMRRAARLGDGYMPYFVTPEQYAAARQTIESEATQRGRDLTGFHWMLAQWVSLAGEAAEAHERVLAHLGRLYRQDFSAIARRYCAMGTPEQVLSRLHDYIAAGVQHLILIPIAPKGAWRDHVEWCARDLLPALHGAAALA